MKLDPNVVGDDSSTKSEGDRESNKLPADCDYSASSTDVIAPEASIVEFPESVFVSETELAVDEPPKDSPAIELPWETAVFIPVQRTPEVQVIQEALPIYTKKQSIMEAIKNNSVVMIHGCIGSGKTTQVPQFLYEAGYAQKNMRIAIMEPRRIAAVQMALKVGNEMNLADAVSYCTEYENTETSKSEIVFMTKGNLMRKIIHNYYLRRYSVIIIDEAHERSLLFDVLIGLLSRIIEVRKKEGNPLKLVIMSATLRVEDFADITSLFKVKPILIKIESRQFPVVCHFEIATPVDYIKAAYKKVSRIHKELPDGAILVFVTDESEVSTLCEMLRKSFSSKDQENKKKEQKKETAVPLSTVTESKKKPKRKGHAPIQSFLEVFGIIDIDYSTDPFDKDDMQHENPDEENEEASDSEEFIKNCNEDFAEPLHVLPLFPALKIEEQTKIFKPPPPGYRLCVVATNVAETSVAIPGVKYVVDTGKVYDRLAPEVSSFAVIWTSKASAEQRTRQAGRTEGGHCYRLYSSAIYENDFLDFTPPDIVQIPVDEILLQIKAFGIDRVLNIPFPTSPDTEALKAAERRLVKLGAIQNLKKGEKITEIEKWEYSAPVTGMGKAMSQFTLNPCFAKMLLISQNLKVLPYAIDIVSAMTVDVFFDMETQDEGEENNEIRGGESYLKKLVRQAKRTLLGDVTALLMAVACYETATNTRECCSKYNICHKAMDKIHKMRLRLIRETNRVFSNVDLSMNSQFSSPSTEEYYLLRKILASGFTDHIAKKMSIEQLQTANITTPGAYMCLDLEEPVYIHPSSVLSKRLPEFVAYQDIFRTSKYFMRTVWKINPKWLASLSPSQCEFSSPLENPSPYYDKDKDKIMCSVTTTFSHRQWMLPCVKIEMPAGNTKYNWFCHFFLDGQICPMLSVYKEFLVDKPDIMLGPLGRLLKRTFNILEAVASKKIDSRQKLFQVWDENPKFLLQEYLQCSLNSKHGEISNMWPPKKNSV